jgi:hypothetical protein
MIWTRFYHPKCAGFGRTRLLLSAPQQTLRYQDATNASFMWDGRSRHAPAPTISLNFSRSNARGRSDLHRPKDAWTSRTDDSPGILQDRCGMNAASSPFRQSGLSRLAATGRTEFRKQARRDGLVACASMHQHSRSARRACSAGRVTGRPRYSAESEGGIRRQIRRQPAAGRRERTALMFGYGTVGRSSLHAGGAIGRLTARPLDGSDMFLRETDRVICFVRTLS